MKILLDTHVFLWFISGDRRLSSASVTAIRDPANDVLLSAVSVWEVAIKHAIGKLAPPGSPCEYLARQRERHGVTPLPLEEASASLLADLPDAHRDPFDRMLICQAKHHDLTIITSDAAFTKYSVALFNG